MNALDRVIAYVSPSLGARRLRARMAFDRASTLTRRYEGTDASLRSGGRLVGGGDANAQVLGAGARIREEAHDLVRNNGWALRAVQTWRDVAGPIRFRAQIPGARRADKADRLRTDRIDGVWYDHWQAVAEAGGDTFDSSQVEGIGCMVESGEYLVRRLDEPMRAGLPVPMSLQLLEPDFLDVTRDRALDDGTVVLGGIRLDQRGRSVSYWLMREHPGSTRAFTRRALESVEVPADEVAHVFERVSRPGQVRGITWFAPAIVRLADVSEYDSYEVIRKKVEACLTAIVFGDDPGETMGAVDDDRRGGDPMVKDAYGQRVEAFEPGMIVYSRGRDIKLTEPKGSVGYPDYMRVQLQAVAATLGLTYERMTGDLSQVSFISGRMGEIQLRSRVRTVQDNVLIPRHCERIKGWWAKAAYAAGRIDQPQVWSRWTRPEWESIQPLDDAAADLMNSRSGKRTMPGIIARGGEDPWEQLDEIQEWNGELDARGIVLDSDPRHMTKAGTYQGGQGEGAQSKASGVNGRHAPDALTVEVLKLANGSRARMDA